ncbi:MAG TPA: hypothetical protein VMH91_01195 [Candidatus Paceibacterota bacterium]|nr:hypothetical protein [Candidatus Paceibacterota bacterium]
MKLAQFPNGQSLQPLPAQVHADTSESLQRNATPADTVHIENAPVPVQAPAPTIDAGAAPQGFNVTQSVNSFGSAAPWALLVLALLAVAGGVRLWKSFVE